MPYKIVNGVEYYSSICRFGETVTEARNKVADALGQRAVGRQARQG